MFNFFSVVCFNIAQCIVQSQYAYFCAHHSSHFFFYFYLKSEIELVRKLRETVRWRCLTLFPFLIPKTSMFWQGFEKNKQVKLQISQSLRSHHYHQPNFTWSMLGKQSFNIQSVIYPETFEIFTVVSERIKRSASGKKLKPGMPPNCFDLITKNLMKLWGRKSCSIWGTLGNEGAGVDKKSSFITERCEDVHGKNEKEIWHEEARTSTCGQKHESSPLSEAGHKFNTERSEWLEKKNGRWFWARWKKKHQMHQNKEEKGPSAQPPERSSRSIHISSKNNLPKPLLPPGFIDFRLLSPQTPHVILYPHSTHLYSTLFNFTTQP